MAEWSCTHAAWFVGLALAVRVGAQVPPTRDTQVAQPQRQATPNVTGLPLESAQRLLATLKLRMEVDPKPDGSQPVAKDVVSQQRPGAGQPIPSDRIVHVAVRIPPRTTDDVGQPQRVPNVVGLSLDAARRTLTVGKLEMRVETRPPGLRPSAQDVITRQSPQAGQPVPTDRTVVVEVAIVTPTVMPNVIGQHVDRARATLTARGIRFAYATAEALDTASDVIIRQEPAAGTPIDKSLTARLTGAIEVTVVPDVLGLTVPAARSRLARFVVREQAMPNAAAPNTIFDQGPRYPTRVRPGSTVIVSVAQAIRQPVPDVVGSQVQAATTILERAGFRTGRISDDDDANVATGVVVSQNPGSGAQADPGTPVALTVRSNRVRVPAVRALTEADARQRIVASGLRVGTVEQRDGVASPGTVIDQSPVERTPVPRGSAVSIVVARQAAMTMPNLVGLPHAAAAALVKQRGLMLGVVDTSSTQIRPDTVVSQDPPRDQPVRAGDRVRFTVGSAQRGVVVPNLVGRRVEEARRLLDSTGLQLGALQGVIDSSTGRVASQAPPAGRSVPPRTPVSLDTTIARTIVSLAVTPDRAELGPGDTVRFTASATMNDGTRARARAMWSVRGGGTITSDGIFTAGADSGSFDVTATDFAGVASATARVRVTAAPVPVTTPVPVTPSPTPVQPAPVVVPRTWPRWILWLGLGIVALAAAATLLRKKPPPPPPSPPPQVAPPSLTYSPGATPPSFSIHEGTSTRGIELSLTVKDDPGVQAVAETQRNAPEGGSNAG